MNELSLLISGAIGIFSIIITIMIYSQLSTLNKNQVKTNILLSKIYKQSGGKLSDEDIKKLNN
jgi:hypothetical protein